MPETPELTDKFLMEIAGWPVFKQARGLWQSGQVMEVSRAGNLVQGKVGTGQRFYSAGLEIRSRASVKNLCTCAENKRRGVICAHSIAACLELREPRGAKSRAASQAPTERPAPEEPRLPEIKPEFVTDPVVIADENLPEFALQIILPPAERLPDLFQRGQIMVTLEAQIAGKGQPLQSLPKKARYACSEDDLRVLRHIWELNQGELAGLLNLNSAQFLALCDSFSPLTRLSAGRKIKLSYHPDPVTATLRIEKSASSFTITSALPEKGEVLLGDAGALFLQSGRTLRPLCPGLPAAYLQVLHEPVVLPEDAGIRFLATELDRLAEFFEIEKDEAAQGAFRMERAEPEVRLEFEGSLNFLEGKLQFLYPDRKITAEGDHAPEPFSIKSNRGKNVLLLRHGERELQCVKRLQQTGFTWDARRKAWTMKGERDILTFFAADLPELRRDWTVNIGARFGRVTQNVEVIEPEFEVHRAGENWLEFDYRMTTDSGETFGRDQITRMLQTGQNVTRRDDGKIAVFDPGQFEDFHEVLRDVHPKQLGGGTFRIDARQAGFLKRSLPEDRVKVDADAAEFWRTWEMDPRGPRKPELPDIGDLAEILRDYQKTGVAWLSFLARHRLGGILADDMGLGKTVQALAALRALREPANTTPCLVICPTSLVANWESEAARFVPELRRLVLQGPDRQENFAKIAESDLVITSYALLRRDLADYGQTEFDTVILDEAQHIKNPETQNARAAFKLKAQRRFVLTGTPLENTVRDLWSIMHFLMPGYLGKQEDFKQRYELPLSSGGPGTGAVRDRLRRRLRPFMLRRRKDEVLADLPPKIEQTLFCDLSGRQAELYTEILRESRRQVHEAAGEKNRGKQRMLMLTALLRLRQACCDPRLLQKNGEPAEHKQNTAAKPRLLRELLEEATDSGHRVLIFSQFATMLRLLAGELREREMDYCHLDGATRDRQAVIDRFRDPAGPPVFLLSLKAGGVGLNLSAADTVVHFDPWWNPAVEAQATDRAHRLGQQNVVTAYKLIARGTIEEKILALQQKKRQAIDAIVESDEPMMQGLTMEEIQGLIEE